MVNSPQDLASSSGTSTKSKASSSKTAAAKVKKSIFKVKEILFMTSEARCELYVLMFYYSELNMHGRILGSSSTCKAPHPSDIALLAKKGLAVRDNTSVFP